MLGERFEVMKLAQTNASYQPIFNQCTTSAPSENKTGALLLLAGIEVEHWLKMG